MANKRDPREQEEIKVTDRRRFSAEGEVVRHEPEPPVEEPPKPEPPVEEPPKLEPPVQEPPKPQPKVEEPPPPKPSMRETAEEDEAPAPPTDAEQQASRDAFREAGGKLDAALESALGAQHRPEAMKATFETFVAEIYMSAMIQLGLLHEQGQQPRVDLVGARHAIDTLVMIEEKTRGNLTETEKGILQDCLFRLRMAFVEVTNVLTRPPEPGAPGPGRK
jgi:hypothetical protein